MFRREDTLHSPHDTRPQCEEIGRAYIKERSKPDSLKALGLEKNVGVGLIMASPIGRRDRVVEIVSECWPDTVDPRGPKGK